MRRQVVLGAAAGGTVAPPLVACSSSTGEQETAHALRRPIAAKLGDRAGLMRELVRYATLAPSSHNTQCWTFHLQDRAIVIAPDLSRRCPIVDPDDHHLFVSLGCASENLAQASLANGLQADVRFDPISAGSVVVGLDATKASACALFLAIAERQCTRGDYDGKPISSDELRLLERAGSGNGVRVLLLTERAAMEQALGTRNAFLNQPVEVGAIRPQFASALGLGSQRPDLVVRFGRGPAMPLSMRRPVQAVLV